MCARADSRSCSFRAELAVRVAAGVVRLRQQAACPEAAAVGFGQYLVLSIVPLSCVPTSGAQEDDGCGCGSCVVPVSLLAVARG
eukprot:6673047-Pyramimonas_sp.AAC.1